MLHVVTWVTWATTVTGYNVSSVQVQIHISFELFKLHHVTIVKVVAILTGQFIRIIYFFMGGVGGQKVLTVESLSI